MTTNLSRLVEAFTGLQVLVIGEAMLDSYLEGCAGRLCREAPVPIVALSDRRDVPGGAANTTANVRGLGSRVAFLSVTGDDLEGDLLHRALAAHGVPADGVLVEPSRRTLAKHRVIADGQMLLRFDQGSTGPVRPETEAALIERLTAWYPRCDAVIVSDYGYGVLTPRVIQALHRLQRRTPRVLAVDAKNPGAYRGVGATAVKPNYHEAARLLGLPPAAGPDVRARQMVEHGEALLDLTEAQIAAVTLDTDGALAFERGSPPYRTYARPTRPARAAGAGDTFVGTLALALAAGAHTPAAVELASAAAAVVVGKDGTAACTAAELREYLSLEGKYLTDPGRLAARVEFYRQQGRRIVFTNGCFDILHRGHIAYLSRAKALGDVLIVGVNSDAGVRRLKGSGRPINTLEDRAQVLAALSCIDHIIPFDDDTPAALIRAIRPDVFAKGGDYTRETLPEAEVVDEVGGSIHFLPYVEDRSTTGIIQRIRAAEAGAAGPDGRRGETA